MTETAAACWSSLRIFSAAMWPVVLPGVPYRDGQHLRVVCSALQDVAEGRCNRLIINVPPRHAKSLMVSTFFPAWLWLRNPSLRLLTASYSRDLATRDAVLSRTLIESAEYQALLPEFALKNDQNLKTSYATDRGGARVVTSTGSGTTGANADIAIGDDLHSALGAYSDAERNAACDWYDLAFQTRLTDRRKGSIILCGQRLHEDDVVGRVLAREKRIQDGGRWRVVCLPGRYEPDHPYACPEDWRKEKGEVLWPEHMPDDLLAEMETALGTYGTAGQIQQRPAPLGGGMLKPAKIQPWTAELPAERFATVDLAASTKTSADYTVITIGGRTQDGRIVIDEIMRGRWEVPQTRAMLSDLYASGRVQYIGVETANAGLGLIQDLQGAGLPIKPLKADKDKVTRAIPLQIALDNGRVFSTKAIPPEVAHEMAQFPNGKHDDAVDSLAWLALECQTRPIYAGDGLYAEAVAEASPVAIHDREDIWQ